MKRSICSWCLLVLVILLGCVREVPEEVVFDKDFPEGEPVTVTFTVPDIGLMPGTRALGEQEELNTLHLAVFGSSGYLKEYVRADECKITGEYTYKPTPDGEYVKVDLYEFSVTLSLTQSKRTVHFIGNGPDFLPFGYDYEILPTLLSKEGEGAFWQMIKLNGIGALKKDNGEYDLDENGKYKPDGALTKAFETIPLIRNWAKIVVHAAPKEDSYFVPKSYAVIYAPTRGSIVPYSSSFIQDYQTYQHDDLEKIYNANLPVGADLDVSIPAESEFKDPDHSDRVSKVYDDYKGGVFLYERPVPSAKLKPSALIVYGDYYQKDESGNLQKVRDYFYKIDLMRYVPNTQGVAEPRYYPVFRNFQYEIKITKILAPGHVSPQAAANAAGSADVSADINTRHLSDISDGQARLVVDPWMAHTFIDQQNNNQQLRVKFLDDIASTPNIDPGAVAVEVLGSSGVILTDEEHKPSVLPAKTKYADESDIPKTDPEYGWRTIQFSTSEPNGITRSQTLRVIGKYTGDDNQQRRLYRDIVITLQQKQAMRLSLTYPDGSHSGSMPRDVNAKLKLNIEIPYGLPESMFPLDFTIEAEKSSLTPDESPEEDPNHYQQLPVVSGLSLTGNGKQTIQFVRTLTLEEYLSIKPDEDENSGRLWCSFVCPFKTTQKDNATTIWVENDYFLSENSEDKAKIAFSNDGSPTPIVSPAFYVEAVDDDGCTVSLKHDGLEFLKDENGWTSYSAKPITLNKGEKVYFRSNEKDWSGTEKFEATGNFKIGGNIASLIVGKKDNWEEDLAKSQTGFTFKEFFKGETGLTDASYLSLPMTSMTSSSYQSMFEGCINLTKAPKNLPATTLSDYCYESMFSDCTGLTAAPTLSATTLAKACYKSMFSGCTSLAAAPALSVKTLTESCYESMFSECTGLTAAPTLSATTLAKACYKSMFSGCTNEAFTSAPALSVENLEESCYESMFSGCTGLTSAPALPATTLAKACYKSMFQGCTGLTEAPALPATTLAANCYLSMFEGCTDLEKAPILRAPSLVDGCYKRMFAGCTSLKEIKMLARGNFSNGTSGISEWVSGIDTEGDYYGYVTATMNANALPPRWNDRKDFYIEYTADTDGTVTYSDNNLQYSLNWGEWEDCSGTAISVKKDDIVLFKNSMSSTSPASAVGGSFSASGSFKVGGDPTSLVAGDRYLQATSLPEGAFAGLFKNSQNLVSAKQLVLPDNLISKNCCKEMFTGCTSLTEVPTLRATTLAESCYESLFSGCTALTSAPSLATASTLAKACYRSMFSGCTSMATAPALSVKTLAESCYESMFSDCTGLTAAPALSATTLAKACYKSMFSGCTNAAFTKAPTLSVTKLKESCYESMFSGCTKLTTAPTLAATTMQKASYRSMFSECNSLATAPALPATTLAESCYESMFSGCTGLTSAPALPATTLAEACYKSMFSGCSNNSFTSASLPATTLAASCYQSMFSEASNISMVSLSATVPATDCFTEWLKNVAPKGFLLKTSGLSLPSPSWSGIPQGWSLHAPFFIEARTACKVSISKRGVKYSEDGVNWTDYTSGESKDLPVGKKLFFSASITDWTGKPVSVTNGNFAIGGSLASLIVGPDNYESNGPSATDWKFENFMNGKTNLLDASMLELPMTTITASGYKNFFSGCTNLVSGPLELPANSIPISGYESMFSGCSNLTSAPAIRGEIIDNYGLFEMFANCSKLVTAPVFAPKKIISTASIGSNGGACQQMFKYCDLLSDISGVNIKGVTQMKKYCFRAMFERNSITSAPELPAAEVPLAEGCYRYMFSLCTKLTKAPELKAKKLVNDCYNHIFDNCYLLEEVKIYAEENITDSALKAWLNNAGRDVTSPVLYRVSGVNILNVPDKWEKRDL